MIRNDEKMCNDSDAYRKVNKHHIAQKQFPMLTVDKKIDDKKYMSRKSIKSTKLTRRKV